MSDASTPTRADLGRFVRQLTAHLATLQDPNIDLVFAVDDRDEGISVLSHAGSDAAATAGIDQMLGSKHRMAALVCVTGWTPDGTSPVRPAWVIVAVGTGGLPALGAVRRIREDTRWTRLPPNELPWFALSTASGLRAALDGEPLRLKSGSSAELHRRPDEVPDPPLDQDGRL